MQSLGGFHSMAAAAAAGIPHHHLMASAAAAASSHHHHHHHHHSQQLATAPTSNRDVEQTELRGHGHNPTSLGAPGTLGGIHEYYHLWHWIEWSLVTLLQEQGQRQSKLPNLLETTSLFETNKTGSSNNNNNNNDN